jgi:hypothetical protein
MTSKRPSIALATAPVWLIAASWFVACGGDDEPDTIVIEHSDAGAPSFPPSYPPALGPEDCAVSTSEVSLTQPEGAAVWGGLVLLEFDVEGGKVDGFDVQAYDPALGGWSTTYVRQEVAGQRDDGSYFFALRPTFSAPNRDAELKLRIRPTQSGCPDAEWTETDAFTAGDPISETAWEGTVPSELFSSSYTVQRSTVPDGTPLPTTTVALGDVTLSVDFGEKGVVTQELTVPLLAAEDEPFHDCTLVLNFEGTYAPLLRHGYEGFTLALSEQRLVGWEGTTCTFPALADLTELTDETTVRLDAYTQGVDINYLPLLYSEPSAPLWQNHNFSQIFSRLTQVLTYVSADETGSMNGYVYPQELVLEKQ